MYEINQVMLVGRLTRDAELKYTQANNRPFLRFAIANNPSNKEDGVGFFESVMWGDRTEKLNPYMKKGTLVAVSGQLTQRRWQDDSGKNNSIVEINVQNLQFVGGGRGDSNQSSGYGNSAPSQGNYGGGRNQQMQDGGNYPHEPKRGGSTPGPGMDTPMDEDEDSIPF